MQGYMESEHTIVGQRDMGDARFDYVGLVQKWFDHFLKGGNDKFQVAGCLLAGNVKIPIFELMSALDPCGMGLDKRQEVGVQEQAGSQDKVSFPVDPMLLDPLRERRVAIEEDQEKRP